MEAHGEDLRAVTNDSELATQVKRDYRKAKLDTKTRAMCDYAVRLTRDPVSAAETDIKALRRAGLTDEEIHDATQVIALFNYYTRLAHALGVEPEDFMPRPSK
ncbi:MAG TPA: peroxidase-related enzyme [Candidatus Limnocylindria bacterium]|nr:peroxidase-related enzyme [Candidatus Limnocylindria bacterium]